MEDSTLIGCSDKGLHTEVKEKNKERTSEENVGRRPPPLQLGGENKESKALKTKRHTEEEEGRCET